MRPEFTEALVAGLFETDRFERWVAELFRYRDAKGDFLSTRILAKKSEAKQKLLMFSLYTSLWETWDRILNRYCPNYSRTGRGYHSLELLDVSTTVVARESPLDYEDEHGRNPLHQVCFWFGKYKIWAIVKHSQITDRFESALDCLKHIQRQYGYEVDINRYDIYGQTPLMTMVKSLANSTCSDEEVADIINFFCDNGAYIYLRDRNGNTALSIAAHLGVREAVRILIERGADVNTKNDDGLTPLDRAKEAYISCPRRQKNPRIFANRMKTLICLWGHVI
ncbi:ankyrin repeat-containing domain protein [Lineolata rhizophorae]|uniref:Ankyrin repeat-containing domain protein n=1 Tax=Lineolata rhizophorae TaxID=578093 RepID=A0A6A6NKZ0_9PEZI|nr:ankyrin repeat-containing domain protein [Lineolata rhizophorae]